MQGALGCGSSTQDNFEPESVSLPDDIAGIAAGHYHSLAWTSAGRLFTWG
jgi:alpha-tubulin suppressor-like RCC1 family protein